MKKFFEGVGYFALLILGFGLFLSAVGFPFYTMYGFGLSPTWAFGLWLPYACIVFGVFHALGLTEGGAWGD